MYGQFQKRLLFLLIFLVVSPFLWLFSLKVTNATSSVQNELQNYINSKSKGIDHISIYYYEFNTKQLVTINANYQYIPASLLQVACMITYYKYRETHPEILEETVVYREENGSLISQNIIPSKSLKALETYTIFDLIKRMITYSDNYATNLLVNSISTDELIKTFTDLGITPPSINGDVYRISISDYAKFFISLYNASYLTTATSQQAIDLLKQPEYKEGIAAGVPNNIVVAGKFGERTTSGADHINQFHDCGIVYLPNNPYLLCVMTDGVDIYQQEKLVKDISNFVYNNLAHKN